MAYYPRTRSNVLGGPQPADDDLPARRRDRRRHRTTTSRTWIRSKRSSRRSSPLCSGRCSSSASACTFTEPRKVEQSARVARGDRLVLVLEVGVEPLALPRAAGARRSAHPPSCASSYGGSRRRRYRNGASPSRAFTTCTPSTPAHDSCRNSNAYSSSRVERLEHQRRATRRRAAGSAGAARGSARAARRARARARRRCRRRDVAEVGRAPVHLHREAEASGGVCSAHARSRSSDGSR